MSILIILLIFMSAFSMALYHFTIIARHKKFMMLSANLMMMSVMVYILLDKGMSVNFLMALMLVIAALNVLLLFLYFKYQSVLVAKYPDIFKPLVRR